MLVSHPSVKCRSGRSPFSRRSAHARQVGAVGVAVMLAGLVAWLPGVGAASARPFAVAIGGGPVRATGDGALTVPLQCRSADGACTVKITISARQRRGRPRRIVVAQRTLSLTGSGRYRARVALTHKGLRLLVSSATYELPTSIQAQASSATGQTARAHVNRTVFMGKPATGCWPHHSSTVIVMGGGRVYDYPNALAKFSSPAYLFKSYGCPYAHGRDYALDDPSATKHPEQLDVRQLDCLGPSQSRFACPAIAGPYVAYGEQGLQTSTAPNYRPPASMVILNLTSGNVLGKSSTFKHPEVPSSTPEPAIIAVSSAAVAAWTISSYPDSYVNALDRRGFSEIAGGPRSTTTTSGWSAARSTGETRTGRYSRGRCQPGRRHETA